MSLDDRLNVAAQLVDSQFISDITIQYAWDSVSLTSILSCPRRYQYQILLGLTPNSPSYAIALVFGILFHKGCEHYHKARALNDDHDAAVFAAVKALLADPATATLPVDDHIDELASAHDPDEDDGITLRNSKIRTRYYLFRALVWYLEHYADDPCKTIILASGKPAVELSFRLPLQIDVLGTPLLLCGHIDRGIEFNGQTISSDYKTTKSLTQQWAAMFDLSHQMTGYTIAGTALFNNPTHSCMIDGVALQVGQVKLSRSFTRRTQGQVDEYFDLLRLVRDQAIRYAETGNYPMNTASCYFCEYKEVCRQPPEYRDRYIKQHYTRRPGWNPLENR
jgi:hypothetical protein